LGRETFPYLSGDLYLQRPHTKTLGTQPNVAPKTLVDGQKEERKEGRNRQRKHKKGDGNNKKRVDLAGKGSDQIQTGKT